MDTERLLKYFDQNTDMKHWGVVLVILILMTGVYALVYQTGGIKFVYSHSMYIPILLSGLVFGSAGGIIFGLIGGIILGPFMPIDVETGEPQESINWLYRTGFFALIGFFSGVASDAARSYVKKLQWISFHDRSTGLPNRSALIDAIKKLSLQKNSADLSHLLIAVSLENKIELKAALGFGVIEEAFVQLAKRFTDQDKSNQIFYTDTAQLVILTRIHHRKAEDFLHEISNISKEPILHNDIPIHIDTRMGYVIFDRISEEPEVYLRKAEAALTVAYQQELDSVPYTSDILSCTKENLSILGELKGALSEGQLSLYYQPKIVIATGEVHGVEALIRWHHPVRGEILPDVFISRAEQSTLIDLLTEFSLEQAIDQIKRWQEKGISMPVSVNISPKNLVKPGFSKMVLRHLNHYGISSNMLELEITERGLMLDIERTIEELNQLVGAQLIISIDDFGTGYSSLQYLHRLPVSLIKIDQSFILKLPNDKGAANIVEAAVTLAHKMGIKVLAEGVENQQIYDYLAKIGCDQAQGFLFSRPIPAEEFERWWIAYKRRPTQVSSM
ncbi:bifunctional diguanylate cyclase/phosphodiesterase [Sulfurovum sp.]|jgi:EAL domain-containing protein (putative c-di-GMP-specific phosphodiesterase class I)/GGDEF domain-containing protein|uniref:putative bifunctional diguanylate cyclase/phosphodiesterase n=1 Tax=Sulfurovum sp. TaxID=1969726 RepID=UPI002A36CF59|nr:bifunctional diguanylate cyclase/phosphodiesterase [Sulfurovum sp.]MDY0402526.1 bifunctional diguanylate cyclase/phosphodiesterase [Sulfurovum sp.]